MIQPPPAQPGMPEDEVDTPALIIDLDAFEANLDTMAAALKGTNVRLRPHAKTHKCPMIAHLQMQRGAVGQCVQKVGEAEALVWGGVPDVLVSNEIVGESKLNRLAALARVARISVCADSKSQIRNLEAAAARFGVSLEVLVEINAGGNRCGVDTETQALELARIIANAPHLTFGGLQAYQGSAQHLRTVAQRTAAIEHAASRARATMELLNANGLSCRTIAGAGTGTFTHELASGIYNELQAGSYVFMDADYARNLDDCGAPVSLFRQSLFVLSTVMSTPRPGIAVLDAGHKAVPVDSGLPLVWGRPGVIYVDASDEHGKLEGSAGIAMPAEGEKLRLLPGHCDPAVDCYDWYVGVRHGQVECLWPIAARGAMH